jgi:hypothetical protein
LLHWGNPVFSPTSYATGTAPYVVTYPDKFGPNGEDLGLRMKTADSWNFVGKVSTLAVLSMRWIIVHSVPLIVASEH